MYWALWALAMLSGISTGSTLYASGVKRRTNERVSEFIAFIIYGVLTFFSFKELFNL